MWTNRCRRHKSQVGKLLFCCYESRESSAKGVFWVHLILENKSSISYVMWRFGEIHDLRSGDLMILGCLDVVNGKCELVPTHPWDYERIFRPRERYELINLEWTQCLVLVEKVPDRAGKFVSNHMPVGCCFVVLFLANFKLEKRFVCNFNNS